ncbi:hypothetical protein [Phycicoccus sp. 3266]|uniref:hypothetical protein n=1 Tax=Phycicoccus sp. 3266 TaxID=2817751 RepID=UPI0028609614|nr:hypothetical protein [Phycicoccus sp. 3266]MDR6862180.1 hypothetical protein [Phycicoccus sp. 3266]
MAAVHTAAAHKAHARTAAERRKWASELATEQIKAYAAKIVAEAPPLTQDQCDRIAAVLRGGA